jgi:hypothetical protein
MTAALQQAVEKGFFWLDNRRPLTLKEKSRVARAYMLWGRDGLHTLPVRELADRKGENTRDIARAASCLALAGMVFPSV